MRDNPLQFAVVREDALTLLAVVEQARPRRALLIGSGGCSALSLAATHPEVAIDLLDPNPAQLAHIEAKRAALATPRSPARDRLLNIDHVDPDGLNERGNFESLFRGLRGFLYDLVAPRSTIEAAFRDPARMPALAAHLQASPYWPVAFQLFFHDALLHAMFGPDATQHAAPGSYPGYFQRVFERGLARPDASANPFLQHLLLGCYLDGPHLPPWLRLPQPAGVRFTVHNQTIDQLADVRCYQLVDLSNIFDWMEPAAVQATCARLAAELPEGAWVVWRQLNNQRDLRPHFGPGFEWHDERAAQLWRADRSLFYERLMLGSRCAS